MNSKPIVSAAEFEALVQDWGREPYLDVDKFAPIRFWFLFALIFITAGWLLFNSNTIAQSLATDPQAVKKLQIFLYFRGWFLIVVLTIGSYAYLRNWFPSITFSIALLVSLTNLVSDIFTVYPERLANPTPFFTFLLLLRITGIWFLYLMVKNSSRFPRGRDRWNIFLPFKKVS